MFSVIKPSTRFGTSVHIAINYARSKRKMCEWKFSWSGQTSILIFSPLQFSFCLSLLFPACLTRRIWTRLSKKAFMCVLVLRTYLWLCGCGCGWSVKMHRKILLIAIFIHSSTLTLISKPGSVIKPISLGKIKGKNENLFN